MDLGSISSNDLAKLCQTADSADVWLEFVRRFQKPLATAVMRTARACGEHSPQFADDMVQNVFMNLCVDNCKALKGFVSKEEHSIDKYLKTLAINETLDHLRSEHRIKRGRDHQRVQTEDGSLDFLEAKYGSTEASEREVVFGEIDRALLRLIPAGTLTERDRTIFWLYFGQGYTARAISDIPVYRLSESGVESLIRRSLGLVRESLKLSTPAFPKVAAKKFFGAALFSTEKDK